MPGIKTIRALSRGLEVLRLIEIGGPATLNDLARHSGLPKATVKRVLLTLEKDAYVRRGIGDQLYHLTVRDGPTASQDWKFVLAEVAGPVLDRLCNAVLWPSDVAIYEAGAMHVQETTRRLSPFVLNRDVLSAHIHVLPSAMGRAFLAWSTSSSIEKVLERLASRSDGANKLARDREAVDALIESIRAKGYAVRNPGYFITHRGEAQLSAIARPLRIKGESVGAFNLAWVSSAANESDFAARYLDQLIAAASEIESMLDRRFETAPVLDY